MPGSISNSCGGTHCPAGAWEAQLASQGRGMTGELLLDLNWCLYPHLKSTDTAQRGVSVQQCAMEGKRKVTLEEWHLHSPLAKMSEGEWSARVSCPCCCTPGLRHVHFGITVNSGFLK